MREIVAYCHRTEFCRAVPFDVLVISGACVEFGCKNVILAVLNVVSVVYSFKVSSAVYILQRRNYHSLINVVNVVICKILCGNGIFRFCEIAEQSFVAVNCNLLRNKHFTAVNFPYSFKICREVDIEAYHCAHCAVGLKARYSAVWRSYKQCAKRRKRSARQILCVYVKRIIIAFIGESEFIYRNRSSAVVFGKDVSVGFYRQTRKNLFEVERPLCGNLLKLFVKLVSFRLCKSA